MTMDALTSGKSEPIADRLDDLVLARLATMARPPTKAALIQALRAFAPTTYDDARWTNAIEGSLERLVTRKQVDEDRVVLSTAQPIGRRFGVTGPLTWKRIHERAVPALTLGIAVDDVRAQARLKDRDQWAAATAARALGLWKDGPPPSLSALCDALVWRSLQLGGSAKRTPPEVRAHFVRQVLPTGTGTPARMVHLLAAREAGAPRADLRALREALVRRWVCGQEWTASIGSAATGSDFATSVRAAANEATEGVFGGRKVFINSVWRTLRAQPTFESLTLTDFKQGLIGAHKAGLVTLSRADLTSAMDAAAVRDSEISHLEARYHFVERGDAS